MFKWRFRKQRKNATEVEDDETQVGLLQEAVDANAECNLIGTFQPEIRLEPTESPSDEEQERREIIKRLLDGYRTLEELHKKVTQTREVNKTLTSENKVLGDYIKKLIDASSVFEPTK